MDFSDMTFAKRRLTLHLGQTCNFYLMSTSVHNEIHRRVVIVHVWQLKRSNSLVFLSPTGKLREYYLHNDVTFPAKWLTLDQKHPWFKNTFAAHHVER